MEFRILGPLEIVDDGRTLALRGSKKRALLAILLLHANEVVSRERLMEDLWGERKPETAATALHGYVSQLRKVLQPEAGRDQGVLVTQAPGYKLRVDAETVDLERFQRLAARGKRELAAGDAEGAAATLEEALSLWRGPPLAEFSAAPFALVERLKLEEQRLSAIEDRIDADLELGRHGAVIGELERLVAEHPHRERLSADLMLALYRSGRQAEALEVYQRTRRALVEELGIEPGPTLQELERAILNHDRSLELPSQARREPTAPEPVAVNAQERRRWGLRRVLIVSGLVLLTASLGIALALGGNDAGTTRLEPNSVGFIDAGSGRLTRSFAVGREPVALAVAGDSVWVANYRDQTVTRLDHSSGDPTTIPIGGHPTGITSYKGIVWVWTLEELLVPIDPRFNSAGKPVDLDTGGRPRWVRTRDPGRIVAGGGFLWMTAPGTTVIRADPEHLERRQPLIPDMGTNGPLVYATREVWVAGSGFVFPISIDTRITGSGASVGGVVRDLTFGGSSLWVLSGGLSRTGVVAALRRVDPRSRLVVATIDVGDNPRAVAAAAGSVWVASREATEGTIYRVDPAENRAAETIAVGAIPTAIATDGVDLWVAVG